MGGYLLDHLCTVQEFLVGVLVGDGPLGVTLALYTDSEGQVVVVGELGMHLAIRSHSPVATPIREDLDYGRVLSPGLHDISVVLVVAD